MSESKIGRACRSALARTVGLAAVLSLLACHLLPAGTPLAQGIQAPLFTVDSTAGALSARAALDQGPLVLVFYRGHW